jgi:uncharacterized protein (DUF924 family)
MNATPLSHIPSEALSVVEFWTEAGPKMWFAKDDDFDRRFRERFLTSHEAAARRELRHWLDTPEGALALVLLLDQYPRNSFRGSPRMYDTDDLAREMAAVAIGTRHDFAVPVELAVFFYLPFGHSEALPDQERCVALAARLGEPHASRARHHRDLVNRFGRFPHRNAILGRTTTPEEQQYLDDGGYKG